MSAALIACAQNDAPARVAASSDTPALPNIASAAPAVAAPALPSVGAVAPSPPMAAGSTQFAEPPPEHTGVRFEWKETEPGSGVTCKAGHYVGEYMCRLYIIANGGDGAFDVRGTVDLQLEESSDGELLRVRNGKFSSDTLAAIPVQADVLGELDCSAAKFRGQLANGTFSVALGLDVPFTQGTFAGPLDGDYDATTASLSGAWDMNGELDGFPGSCVNGSWSARWIE